MEIWFTSLNGAITLSALFILASIGYTLLEMRYFLEKWIPGDNAVMVETIMVMLIAGGRRGGLAALLCLRAATP